MKAARIHKYGGPDEVKLDTNVPKPAVGDTQVLIKAATAGVNPVDVITISGNFIFKPPLPWIPGWDAAGVVEDVGAKVTRLKKGERVFCAGNVSGAFAQYVVAEEKQTGRLGPKLTFAEGSGLGVPYYTAFKAAMHAARVKAGESILIHGASGAVGMAAVQLCKAMGVHVLGTAGTDTGLTLVKDNGADLAFNHSEKRYEDKIMAATGGGGVDVILEMVGNVNLSRDLQLIAKKGRIVIIGGVGETKIDPGVFLFKMPVVTGVNLPNTSEAEWWEMTAAIEAGIRLGWVRPVVAKEYPLSQAAQALTDIMANRNNPGNLILNI
ncbi:quinone oxidoreductase-like [Littorina saxatilis]|uniref:Enoyl reductase (ER) domain-containing protein n=1 Tax=Littorina saxatilis TaxID=31220 RepID=A0AAN9GH98_9CAEN